MTTLKAVDSEPTPIIGKISVEHFNKHNLQTVFTKIMNTQGLPQKTAYWAGKIGDSIMKFLEKTSADYATLVKEHAQIDETGNLVKEGMGYKIDETKKETFETKDAEFFKALCFECEWEKLNVKDLEKVGLTPKELLALEPLVFNLGL